MINGAHTDICVFLDRIASAMTVAMVNAGIDSQVLSRTVLSDMGEVPEVEENAVSGEYVSVFIGGFDIDPTGREGEVTGQVVKDGRLFINVFASYARRAVAFSELLLKACGYVTEHNALGMPPKAPWQVGNMLVWKFNPTSGFNTMASRFGSIFVCRQLINFTVAAADIVDV